MRSMPINHFTSCWIRGYCLWIASIHCLLFYFATSASPPSHNNSFMFVQPQLDLPIYNIVWRNQVWPRWAIFTVCYHPMYEQLLAPDVSEDDKRPYRKQMWNNLQNYIHKFIYILRASKEGIFSASAFIHIGLPAISWVFFFLTFLPAVFNVHSRKSLYLQTYFHIFRRKYKYWKRFKKLWTVLFNFSQR